MRTTLTVLIAITLTLALGVTHAHSVQIYACKKGKVYRLVEDPTTCSPWEEIITDWSIPFSDEVEVLDDNRYEVKGNTAAFCSIYDASEGAYMLGTELETPITFFITCLSPAPNVTRYIHTLNITGNSVYAVCRDELGVVKPNSITTYCRFTGKVTYGEPTIPADSIVPTAE